MTETIHKHKFEIEQWPTSKVTLYPTCATIERKIEGVQLKPGLNEITISDLTSLAEPESIRVSGTTDSDEHPARINDLTIDLVINNNYSLSNVSDESDAGDESDSDSEEPDPVQAAGDNREQIKDEIDQVKERRDSAQMQFYLLEQYSTHMSSEKGDNVSPTTMEEILELYASRRKIHQDKVMACVKELRALEKKLAKAEKQLRKEQGKMSSANRKKVTAKLKQQAEKDERRRERRENKTERLYKVYRVRLTVELPWPSEMDKATDAFQDATFNLIYTTNSASWTPAYDLRLDTTDPTLSALTYRAHLTNRTYETWSNAYITLSTSQASFGGLKEGIPRMEAWRVTLAKKIGFLTGENGLYSLLEQSRMQGGGYGLQNGPGLVGFHPTLTVAGPTVVQMPGRGSYTPPPIPPPVMIIPNNRSRSRSPRRRSRSRSPRRCSRYQSPRRRSRSQSPRRHSRSRSPRRRSRSQSPRRRSRSRSPRRHYRRQRHSSSPSINYRPRRIEPLARADSRVRTQRMWSRSRSGSFSREREGGRAIVVPSRNTISHAAAGADTYGFTTTYDLPTPRTIGSSSQVRRHVIAEIGLSKIFFTHILIPKLKAAAYLKAKLTNTSNTHLLPGVAGLTLDGSFMGSLSFPRFAPDEEVTLELGVDQGVKVEYERPTVKRGTQGIIIGKEEVGTYKRSMKITNTKGASVALVVLDQVPVPENDKLKVHIIVPKGLKNVDDVVKGVGVEGKSGTSRAKVKLFEDDPVSKERLEVIPETSSNLGSVRSSLTAFSRRDSVKKPSTADVQYPVERKALVSSSSLSPASPGWGTANVTLRRNGEVRWDVDLAKGGSVDLNLEWECRMPMGEGVYGLS